MFTLAPYDPLFEDVLARMLATLDDSYNYMDKGRAVSFTNTGSIAFSITYDYPTPTWALIYVNSKHVTSIWLPGTVTSKQGVKTFSLKLDHGIHRIEAIQKVDPASSTKLEKSSIQVSASRFMTFLKATATEMYTHIHRILNDHELELLSPWSTRRVEQQLAYRHLLIPPSSARTLATRLTLRAAITEPGTGKGVRDFLTGLTFQTPVIQRMQQDPVDWFDTSVNLLLSQQEKDAGYDFHIWLPNSCAADWATFIRFTNALKQDFSIKHLSEWSITIQNAGGEETTHFIEDGEATCFNDYIDKLYGLFDKVVMDLKADIDSEFMFCPWTRTLDTTVVVPLGIVRLDTGRVLDSGGTMDSGTNEDPLGDGFTGADLGWPLDSGINLDTGHKIAHAFDVYDESTEPSKCAGLRVTSLGVVNTEHFVDMPPNPFDYMPYLTVAKTAYPFILPTDTANNYPIWGIRGGVCLALFPTPLGITEQARGRLLLGFERNGKVYFVNSLYITITDADPLFTADTSLSVSAVDGKTGVFFTNLPGNSALPVSSSTVSTGLTPYIEDNGDGTYTMTLLLRSEPLENDAQPVLKITMTSPSTEEVNVLSSFSLQLYETSDAGYSISSAAFVLDGCSYARLRKLHTTEALVTVEDLWPDFVEDGNTDSVEYAMTDFPTLSYGGMDPTNRIIIMENDESVPWTTTPYTGAIKFLQSLGVTETESASSVLHIVGTHKYPETIYNVPEGNCFTLAIVDYASITLGQGFFYAIAPFSATDIGLYG